MAGPSQQALRLARKLRDLRESTWPDVSITQAQLAKVLSQSDRVAVATLASWENAKNPKLPSADKLRLYSLFFCTIRSVEPDIHLVDERDLDDQERTQFNVLEAELQALRQGVRLPGAPLAISPIGQYTWEFHSGKVTIICPEVPDSELSPLGLPDNPNFTRMFRYADLDALIELYGHLRVSNPELDVFHRLPSELKADDLSNHVVVLGGVAWNQVTRQLLRTLRQVPIAQVDVSGSAAGDPFELRSPDGKVLKKFEAVWEQVPVELPDGRTSEQNQQVLTEDVALLVRVRNPYNRSRTLTICNGFHSRGVLGAVRCLTDAVKRDSNEAYLASRFPDGNFAILMRVPVVLGEAITPDLEIDDVRLFEWPTAEEEVR